MVARVGCGGPNESGRRGSGKVSRIEPLPAIIKGLSVGKALRCGETAERKYGQEN